MLTHASFRLHVKIASRIASCRIVSTLYPQRVPRGGGAGVVVERGADSCEPWFILTSAPYKLPAYLLTILGV